MPEQSPPVSEPTREQLETLRMKVAEHDARADVMTAQGVVLWPREVRALASLLGAYDDMRWEPLRFDLIPGGCWTACLAGLTGIPREDLDELVPPALCDKMRSGENIGAVWCEYHNAVVETLHAWGWTYVEVGTRIPRGYAMAIGKSPRDLNHAVIVKDGELWHDPHPSRAGLTTISHYEIVIPIREIRIPRTARASAPDTETRGG